MDLDQLRLFLTILDRGSLSAAARDLGLSPATVSERLAGLEARFSVRLLHRTTRSISVTEEGRALAEGAERLLAEAAELDARIRLGREEVAGPMRISAPSDLGRGRISRVLNRFQETHPGIALDLHLSDGYVDLVGQRFDLAVRYGDLEDSGLMVRRLADCARLVCASPGYLERHGLPEHPEELTGHNCLVMRFGTNTDRTWPFIIDGRARKFVVSGDRTANDGEAVRHWCAAGYGIARKSEWDIAEELSSGQLVPILRAYEPAPIGLQVVYLPGRSTLRRIALVIDALVEEFG